MDTFSDLNPNARPFDLSESPPEWSPPDAFDDVEVGWSPEFGPAVPVVGPATNGNAGYVYRRPSKKEAAAAARRRRHSVDALDFTGLKTCDVHTFLRHIRLHKYSELLQQHHITFEQLLSIDEAGLENLGIHAKGARTRLLKAIDRYTEYMAERAEAIRNGLPAFPEEGFSGRNGAGGRHGPRRNHARHNSMGSNHHHRGNMHQSQPMSVPRANNANGYRPAPRRVYSTGFVNGGRRENGLYPSRSWKGEAGSMGYDDDHDQELHHHVNSVAEHLLGSLKFDDSEDEEDDELSPYPAMPYAVSLPQLSRASAQPSPPSSVFASSLEQAQSVGSDWTGSMSPASYPFDLWGIKPATAPVLRPTSPWEASHDKVPTVKAQ